MKAHIIKNTDLETYKGFKPITGESKRQLIECISPLLIPENERTKEDQLRIDEIMGRNSNRQNR